ncbi:MAG: RsmB/NOP family class I SAM-dependent RNA methyltransferase, partial [Flavobacteriales bacterium]|nr:RsmB/NOP family class I SAM-dependent RNA methyltransferase [Flavobacteriales bacterium]
MARSRRPATHAALPEALLAQLADRLEGGTQDFMRAMGEPPPTSIRLNPDKPFHMGQEAEVVAWCTHGRYLPERPAFTFDPLLHAGAYYVQEASSMFLERAVHAIGPWRDRTLALDMCASPGGKSTHLRSLLPKDALLVANEVEPSRRQALQENLWKWGGWNVVITGAPPAAFLDLGELFDLVLVDAPCSGEGMFRKDPFAREQWNPSLVDRCERVQREILPHAWELVTPGGHLIYSTCTWEERENEDRIASLVA